MKNNQEEVEAIFNALAYFNINHVAEAKKTVEDVISELGSTEQRDTALTAFNKYLHEN